MHQVVSKFYWLCQLLNISNSGCGGCVQIFVQSISDQVSIWCLFFHVQPNLSRFFGGNLCVGKIREAGWEGILGKADERK